MNYLDTIANVNVLKMPVGRAFLLTAAFGVADGLFKTFTRMLGGRLPALAIEAGMAAALENIGPIQKFLGPDATDLIAGAALAAGINGQFDISAMISNGINSITSYLPGMSAQATPVVATTTTSGYQMGNCPTPITMGAARPQLPNVDDVDLTLLASRGYQTA